MELTLSALRQIMPNCVTPVEWVPELNHAMAKFGIVDVNSMAAFLAEAAHESSELNHLDENLYYRPERLADVFGRVRFPTQASIDRVANNPQALANYVYANRYGNGDEASGDGYRFRGGGIFQTTFKDNYRATSRLIYGNEMTLVNDPALIRITRQGAALAAGAFWVLKNLQQYIEDFETLTRRINSAGLGMAARKAYLDRALHVLRSAA